MTIQKGPPRLDSLELTIQMEDNPVPHQISHFVIESKSLAILHIAACEGCKIIGGVGPPPVLKANIFVWDN